MDHHHHHNPPLHWGYSSTPTTNIWVPPPTKGIKRALSVSDCEDGYSEESSKEQTSPGDSDNCHMLSRKKRRGVIEKKRRDRINMSLSELKRLVPSAYEKQGSAKLEKAEILQLTVDHLKSLHSKGLDSMAYDPQRFAMDYHIIGLRECASEVARYLVSIEGMDIQDPLRLRLMSHLQCFVAQREISAKSNGPCTNWGTNNYQSSYAPPSTYHHNNYSQSSINSNVYVPNLTPTPTSTMNNILSPVVSHNQSNISLHTTISSEPSDNHSTSNVLDSSQNVTHAHHSQSSGGINQSASQHLPNAQHYNGTDGTDPHQQTPTYTDLSDHINRGNSSGIGYQHASGYSAGNVQNYDNQSSIGYTGSKPYRPWGGAEMAY